jgi:uncharacterized membrane protein YbaN (DUF454 family)
MSMRIFLIQLLVLVAFVSQAQKKLYYDILYKDRDVGDLVATYSEKGKYADLVVKSKVTAKLIMKVEVSYTMKVKFVDNEMYSSSVVTYVNGNVRNSIKVTRKKDHYLVDEKGELRKYYGKISITDGLLCVKEPLNTDHIFSEFDAIDKPLNSLGNHTYKMTNPQNNNYTVYNYKNGILQQSVVHYTLASFTIRIR